MIVRHTLANGVRVVAEQIPHVRSIAMGIWVGTGSEKEIASENGISHFLEHMMFKGTEKRTARQLAEAFDEIGGHVNAFTSKEITCYYSKVLDQHFATSLEILADMFFHSRFDELELEKEKKVIIEEIRMVEDTPDDLIHDLISEVSLQGYRIGAPVIGTVDNVNSISRDQLVAYRNKEYHPGNVVISLAGNLPGDFLKQIEDLFAVHQGVASELEPESPLFTPAAVTKQKQTEQTHLCFGFPGLPIGDPRIHSLILLNNVLGGNMSSRLFQEIREERGLAYSVFSYHSAHRQTGVFSVYAGTAHKQTEEVCELIEETVAEVAENGITEHELKKAKEQLKGSMMLGLESTNNRMSRLGRNELLLGRHLSLDEVIESVEKITLTDVNQLANKIFTSPKSLALISPEGKVPKAFRGNNG